jgi:hypothetical protein
LPPLLPANFTCAFPAGTQRFADIYFPAGYPTSKQAPLWLILHGLYSVKPAADGSPPPTGGLDHIKRAAEHVAGSMGINKGWLSKEAILVYPDSGGKLPGFQVRAAKAAAAAAAAGLGSCSSNAAAAFSQQAWRQLIAVDPQYRSVRLGGCYSSNSANT